MKIGSGPGAASGASAAGARRGASAGGYSPAGASAPAGGAAPASAASAAGLVGGLDALLALQDVGGPLERRRRALSRGGRVLDGLDGVQLALLDGDDPGEALGALAHSAAEARERGDDLRPGRAARPDRPARRGGAGQGRDEARGVTGCGRSVAAARPSARPKRVEW